MLLNEFFGKPIDTSKKAIKNTEEGGMGDDLFWFIIDHDRLHKDFFHPIAQKIHRADKSNRLDKEKIVKDFMPMVNKGCMEFFHHTKMGGDPKTLFHKEFRKDIAERLFDHYQQDIISGKYKIGV